MSATRGVVVAVALASLVAHSSIASAQHVVWVEQFGTRAHDTAFHVATGPDGTSFVVGLTFGAFEGFTNAGDSDAFVAIVRGDGSIGSVLQFGTAGGDVATGVATSANGGAYVVGGMGGGLLGGGFDAFVRKLRPNGNFAWTRRFGTSDHDIATAVDVQGRGVYVGSLWGGGNTGVVRRYSSSGEVIWKRRIPAGAHIPVAADRSGVYVAGSVQGEGEPGEDLDVFVRAFEHGRDVRWTRRFATPESEQPLGIDVREGVVYLAGHTRGSLSGSNVGKSDVFVQTFDTDGAAMWTRQWGTGDADFGWDVEADAAANSYVVGFVGQDAFVTKLDPDGTELWTTMLSTTEQDEARAVSLAADLVYVAGSTFGRLDGSTGGRPTGMDAFLAALGGD
jgi:hypothetical protein